MAEASSVAAILNASSCLDELPVRMGGAYVRAEKSMSLRMNRSPFAFPDESCRWLRCHSVWKEGMPAAIAAALGQELLQIPV